jgi:hypothetical protein
MAFDNLISDDLPLAVASPPSRVTTGSGSDKPGKHSSKIEAAVETILILPEIPVRILLALWLDGSMDLLLLNSTLGHHC